MDFILILFSLFLFSILFCYSLLPIIKTSEVEAKATAVDAIGQEVDLRLTVTEDKVAVATGTDQGTGNDIDYIHLTS